MNLEGIFDFCESPAFMVGALWFCLAIVAMAIIMGVLRAAGRGNDGR